MSSPTFKICRSILPGVPNHILRCCTTPDRKRVVAAWMLYMDMDKAFPFEKDWEIPKTPLPPPYEIRPVESKGRGMIATRSIKRGELILCERPVLMFPYILCGTFWNRWASVDKEVLQLLYWLEQEDRERLVKLHNCKSLDDCGPITGIVRTNGLGAEFPQSKICSLYSALCLDISCINHSCIYNADYVFDHESVTFSVHATRDIAAGEEITISYVQETLSYTERQQYLRQDYCFTCTCALCSASPAEIVASDNRRKTIKDGLEIIESFTWAQWFHYSSRAKKDAIKRYVDAAEALLRASDEENLRSGRMTVLDCCAFLYADRGDMKNFKRWAKRCLMEAKKGNDETDKWEGWLKDPKSCPVWDSDNRG